MSLYRAATKAPSHAGPPVGATERDMEVTQTRLTKAEAEVIRRRKIRNALMIDLWKGGMTQAEIASRLSRAAAREGGSPVTLSAVQKALYRKINGRR